MVHASSLVIIDDLLEDRCIDDVNINSFCLFILLVDDMLLRVSVYQWVTEHVKM